MLEDGKKSSNYVELFLHSDRCGHPIPRSTFFVGVITFRLVLLNCFSFYLPKPKMKRITLLPRFLSTSSDYEAQNHIHTFHLPSWFQLFVPFVAREEERGV